MIKIKDSNDNDNVIEYKIRYEKLVNILNDKISDFDKLNEENEKLDDKTKRYKNTIKVLHNKTKEIMDLKKKIDKYHNYPN